MLSGRKKTSMHVIVSTHAAQRWISGIFLNPVDAEACLASLRTNSSQHHSMESIGPSCFPFFIFQDRSGFRFLDLAEATELIASMSDPAPDAEPMLFAIVAEYRPDVAGRDEMGRLQHAHLDRECLEQLRTSGIRSLAV
jgi:hypothetical protein